MKMCWAIINEMLSSLDKYYYYLTNHSPAIVTPDIVSCRYRLTTVAIDWQVLAANQRYYDILYVGTGKFN